MTALLGIFWPYLAGAGVLILTVLGVYVKGRSDASDKAAQDRNESHIQTLERMRDANSDDRDADAINRRLRDLSK